MTAQSEATPTPASAKIKEWLGAAAVAALIIAGMFGAIKLANAPLQAGIQAIHGRPDRMQNDTLGRMQNDTADLRREVTALRQDMNDEFKAVRKGLATLGERLPRMETLLEQNAGQPEPATTPEPE